MYHVNMAFVLIQVGTNLWVNPMQVQGIRAMPSSSSECQTMIVSFQSSQYGLCSDWPLDEVKRALRPAAVLRAAEEK